LHRRGRTRMRRLPTPHRPHHQAHHRPGDPRRAARAEDVIMQPDDGRQQVFAFAYDRFKVAESDVGGVYSLVGIMLTVQAGLAAGLAATADARLVGQAGHSDTALLYLLLLL